MSSLSQDIPITSNDPWFQGLTGPPGVAGPQGPPGHNVSLKVQNRGPLVKNRLIQTRSHCYMIHQWFRHYNSYFILFFPSIIDFP